MTEPSLINVEYTDVQAVMSEGGIAVMLVGESEQENKAESAVRECLKNPMQNIDYHTATGSLVYILGGADLTIEDTKKVTASLSHELNPDAKVMCSASTRDDMQGKIRVCAIMTGIKNDQILGKCQSVKTVVQETENKRSNPSAVEMPVKSRTRDQPSSTDVIEWGAIQTSPRERVACPRHERKVAKTKKREIYSISGVQFSVTCPKKVKPGCSFILDIWAHMEKQRNEIVKRSTLGYVEPDITIRSSGIIDIKSETPLSIHLELPNLIIERSEKQIIWSGKIVNASFVIQVPENTVPGIIIGKAKIFIDGLQVACVLFELKITDVLSLKEKIPSNVHYYKSAFVSYSRLDLDRVLARVQGIQKAAPYLKIIMDIKDLQSGEKWKEKLRDLIQYCDIFYLFWSKNASQSEWVNKEWRCAYILKGIDFIDPVPLDSPQEVLPPPELSEKHFDEWTLAYSRNSL